MGASELLTTVLKEFAAICSEDCIGGVRVIMCNNSLVYYGNNVIIKIIVYE